jgi:hypothetical protein
MSGGADDRKCIQYLFDNVCNLSDLSLVVTASWEPLSVDGLLVKHYIRMFYNIIYNNSIDFDTDVGDEIYINGDLISETAPKSDLNVDTSPDNIKSKLTAFLVFCDYIYSSLEVYYDGKEYITQNMPKPNDSYYHASTCDYNFNPGLNTEVNEINEALIEPRLAKSRTKFSDILPWIKNDFIVDQYGMINALRKEEAEEVAAAAVAKTAGLNNAIIEEEEAAVAKAAGLNNAIIEEEEAAAAVAVAKAAGLNNAIKEEEVEVEAAETKKAAFIKFISDKVEFFTNKETPMVNLTSGSPGIAPPQTPQLDFKTHYTKFESDVSAKISTLIDKIKTLLNKN